MKKSFSGDDYVEDRDYDRLERQIDRVLNVMLDQKWRTVARIRALILQRYGFDDPENSIQAQLRNLRKPENGSYTVPRKHKGNGLHVYKLGDQYVPVAHPPLEKRSKKELIDMVRRLRRKLKKFR